jgi:cytoskeletal protein RodZ
MTGFGEYLRRERQMRSVSLEEISAATKISLRFLQAIENEELSKLPGGIFTRAFVRTYARYLGLDEERVLVDCQLAAQPKPEVDIRRIKASQPRPQSATSRTRIIAFLVAGALLASGYALFRYSRRIMEQRSSTPIIIPPSSPAHVTAAPSPAPSVRPSAPVQQEDNRLLTATSGSPAAGTVPATPQGVSPSPAAQANPSNPSATSEASNAVAANAELVLQVAATERAWVAVDADGKTVLQKVLIPNEIENLEAHSSFDVTMGNAQGIVLTLNGETLKPLGRHGEVKSIHLTRDDLKNAAPER